MGITFRDIWDYSYSLVESVPYDVYELAGIAFVVGAVVFLTLMSIRKGFRWTSALLLLEYIFIIYCSTVIFRPTNPERRYDFHPFWSYRAIEGGTLSLVSEIIMNVVVFIPVGFLLGAAFKGMTWWKVLLIACSISVSVETLQFFLMRGFSEFDDVMHNTIGGIIGFGLYSLIRTMNRDIRRFQNDF